jgi:hypothetical protein
MWKKALWRLKHLPDINIQKSLTVKSQLVRNELSRKLLNKASELRFFQEEFTITPQKLLFPKNEQI